MGTDKDKKITGLEVALLLNFKEAKRDRREPRMTRMGTDKDKKKSVKSVASVVKNPT